MDRIKRLSYEVLDENKSQFGVDFADNKKILNQISIIRYKTLKNKIAGYITKFIKREIREEKIKQDRIIASKFEQPTESNETVEEITLTNDEVKSMPEIKEIKTQIITSASDITDEDSILKSNSDSASEEKTK